METSQQFQPPHPDLAGLLVFLQDLRDALEEVALALNDYLCVLDCEDSRMARLQAMQTIERAKAQDYGAGDRI